MNTCPTNPSIQHKLGLCPYCGELLVKGNVKMKTNKEFTKIELDTVYGCEEFLAKVPDQYQSEARAALYLAWKLGRSDVVVVSADSVVETNRQLLLDRSNVGISKYGVTLEKANLSEEAILQHALEEALDLANYLQTRLMKIRGIKIESEVLKPIGLKCTICHEPQFSTPCGDSCKNGHGGADGY